MSHGVKWVILMGVILGLSMGITVLRNAYGVSESTVWSLIAGVFTGGSFVVAGRFMGLFGKKADDA
ncbi:MAG: hypothetical protein AAFQ64_03875 [Pseudomonadota bacterium]